MNFRFLTIYLSSTVLLLNANLSYAIDSKPAANVVSAETAKSTPASRADIAAKRKAAAKIKPVDINSASHDVLKKLPGITDAEATKIIAGRPYGSKAWLVTQNVIDVAVYENIKTLIIAKQPYTDADKNAALYEKKK